jgi:hypothetical protein
MQWTKGRYVFWADALLGRRSHAQEEIANVFLSARSRQTENVSDFLPLPVRRQDSWARGGDTRRKECRTTESENEAQCTSRQMREENCILEGGLSSAVRAYVASQD